MSHTIYASKHDTGSEDLPPPLVYNGQQYPCVAIDFALLEAIIEENDESTFTVNTGETTNEAFRRRVAENIDAAIQKVGAGEELASSANWQALVLYSMPDGDQWATSVDPFAHPRFKPQAAFKVVVAMEQPTYRSAFITFA